MVVGNGMLAKRFSTYKDVRGIVIFASGVSDSKSVDEAAYRRERDLLSETMALYPGTLLVYFSTCSIHDPSLHNNRYIAHKLAVEELLNHSEHHFMVFRISNVAGPGGNPKTIFHFLAQAIMQQKPFTVWQHAYRNLIDVDDVFKLIDFFLQSGMHNQIINIAHPESLATPDLVAIFEEYFGKKGHYEIVPAGNYFHIDTTIVQAFAAKAGVHFEGDYLYRLLQKYYPLT